jgi:hypothetical protein
VTQALCLYNLLFGEMSIKTLLSILAVIAILVGTGLVLSDAVIVGVFFELISMCLLCLIYLIIRKDERN